MGVTSSRLEKALAEYPGIVYACPVLKGFANLTSMERRAFVPCLRRCSRGCRIGVLLWLHMAFEFQYNCRNILSLSNPKQPSALMHAMQSAAPDSQASAMFAVPYQCCTPNATANLAHVAAELVQISRRV